MQVRNLALNTQTSYVQQVSLFARHFNKSPEELGPEDIRAYQVYLIKERKLAPGSTLIAVAEHGRLEHPPRRDTRFAPGDQAYLIGPYDDLLVVLRRDALANVETP